MILFWTRYLTYFRYLIDVYTYVIKNRIAFLMAANLCALFLIQYDCHFDRRHDVIFYFQDFKSLKWNCVSMSLINSHFCFLK